MMPPNLQVWKCWVVGVMLETLPELVFADLDPRNVVKSRTSEGGTSFTQVEKEVNYWEKKLLL